MNTITYKEIHKVYLNGTPIGEIRKIKGFYQYFPKGQKIGGSKYLTILSCKASLEQE